MAKKRYFRSKRKNIQPHQWLKFKPYKNFDEYDKDYLEIAEQIFILLNKQKDIFEMHGFGIQDMKNLACILTSLFEDIVNEIGIWKVFIEKNRKLYGYYLPFYDMSDYEPGEPNSVDFSYMIWHWMSETHENLFGPDYFFILQLGEDIYELLEDNFEEVNITGYYEHFFYLPDDIHFFELKSRMKWFAFHSYIPGSIEFSPALTKSFEDFAQKKPDLMKMGAGQLRYGMEESYIYGKASSFSALSVLEWFSEISTCSKKTKENIRKLNQRVESMFKFEGFDADYWKFKHIQTGKAIEIVRESVEIDTNQTKQGDIHHLQLTKWKNEWWLSGTLTNWGSQEKPDLTDSEHNLSNIPFYLYSDEQQASIREDVERMYQSFTSYFGKQVVIFRNNKELEKAMKGYTDYYTEQLIVQKKVDPEKKPKDAPTWTGLSQLDDLEGIAAAYIQGIGSIISPAIPKAIYLMKKKSLDKEEKVELFYLLIDGSVHPTVANYLMEEYPTHNFVFPIPVSQISAKKHAEFLMRFMNSEDFEDKVPMMRYMPE